MSEYIPAIDVEGFESGTMRKVDIEGHEFLVAKIGESFYVTDDRCPHLHGDLSKGVLEGSIVTCPRHHSQFDLTDGHVVRWTDFGRHAVGRARARSGAEVGPRAFSRADRLPMQRA
jgi:nitrite reductase/ring-hydroxylating ferredoxin subunit